VHVYILVKIKLTLYGHIFAIYSMT